MLQVLKETSIDYGGAGLIPNLGGIRFVVVGGLAAARYMPPRMTLDTDILIASGDLAAAEQALASAGCVRLGPLSVGGSSWRMPGGRTLDVLALDEAWVGEALEAVTHDDAGTPFIALPYLTVMKLAAGRLQDLADISRMLGFAGEVQLHETLRVVSRCRPQDLDDLESMIRLGKREHGDGILNSSRPPPP